MKITKGIKDRYNAFPISQKFILNTIIISIIPILLLEILTFYLTWSAINDQLMDFTQLRLKQAHSNIDGLLKDYSKIIMKISNDDDLQKNLSDMNAWNKGYYTSIYNVQTKLQDIVFEEEGVLGISIISQNGVVAYFDSISLSSVESFCVDFDNIRKSDLYLDCQNTQDMVYGYTKTVSDPVYGEKNIVYIAKQILNHQNLQQKSKGTVIISIDEAHFEKIVMSENDASWWTSFILDKKGSIMSFSEKDYFGKNIYGANSEVPINKAVYDFIENLNILDSNNMNISSMSALDDGFTIVQVVDENYMYGKIRLIFMLMIILVVFASMISVKGVRATSKNIGYKVDTINNAMSTANEKNLDVYVNLEGNDEFSQIGKHFNFMIKEMKDLMQRESEALNKQRVAEISALEAQINPHFLYNTLDAINWMAIDRGEHEISSMLKNLALILRYSVHNSNEVVSMSEELDYLRKYMFLQQRRYGYSFDCKLSVDKELDSVFIHKLLIQPIVENVLIHGFPGASERDKIEVTINKEDENYVLITVLDNGKGMPKDLVDQINAYNFLTDTIHGSIGIRNVIARLHMYYVDKASFKIKSELDSGTTVNMKIPIIKTRDDSFTDH